MAVYCCDSRKGATDLANKRLKVGIYQSELPNPSLHITVTSNEKFFEGRFVTENLQTALQKIEAWLRKHYVRDQGKAD